VETSKDDNQNDKIFELKQICHGAMPGGADLLVPLAGTHFLPG